MSLSISSTKKMARQILKQNSLNFTIAAIIIIAVWFIINNFAAIVEVFTFPIVFKLIKLIFSFFVFAPLLMGFLRYSWYMISDVNENPIAIFYYFSSKKLYFKVLKLLFSLVWRTLFCYLIFYIPVLAFDTITGTWVYSFLDIPIPLWTFNLSTIRIFLEILATTATFFSIAKFYLAPMLFVVDEKMDVAETVHLSTVLSKRTTIDFLLLCFSFVGWILLSYFSFPIIFTLPYCVVSYLIHSTSVVDAFNQLLSQTNYDDIPTFVAGT